VPAGTTLIADGEPPAAMYVVTRGASSCTASASASPSAPNTRSAPGRSSTSSPVRSRPARCEPTRLLRVTREDFHDLLADHSELALGLLQGLAHRMRSLVA
jgi:CRP-like cAMP-binding protein